MRARTGGGRLCWCVRACSEPGSEAKRWAPRGSLVAARRSRESGCLFPRTIIHTTALHPLASPPPPSPLTIHRSTSCPSRLFVPRDFSCTHAIPRTCAVVFVKSVPARTHASTHARTYERTNALTHVRLLVGSRF